MNIIKRAEINIHKSPAGHYFLDITSQAYDGYEAFPNLDDLIKKLKEINNSKSVKIEDLDKIIAEIKLSDKK